MAKKLTISSLVRPCVRSLTAYEAKEIPCRVKLDANESPFGFPASAAVVQSNRYPDPEARALRTALARQMQLSMENILVGNGSDELISCLITTFGGPVLAPAPTFVMYGIIATALGERAVTVPLDESFALDEKAMLRAIRAERPKLVFLSSPNNPTGNCFATESVLRIIEATRSGIVVLDEAYHPFASERGLLPLLADYPNVVILRTLSKVGLAALRIGYMAASPEIIAEVNKVRLPFNVNSYSQAHALSALKDRRGMRAAIKKITSERDALYRKMQGMAGIEPSPSEANFILFRAAMGAERLHAELLKRGVLIKKLHPGVPEALRVTVGTQQENRIFIKALEEALS